MNENKTETRTIEFALIIIGDELLHSKRQDRHFVHFREFLSGRGMALTRCWILPDEPSILTGHLRFSMAEALPAFVCGGIGATPDDLTRACAAEAAGLSLERHPEAAALIEGRFKTDAYPSRILMADLPRGCRLIPNYYNEIPGFSLEEHYFLPGFPEMAWPMAEWVLDQYYERASGRIGERSLQILDTAESTLIPIMEQLSALYTGIKMFSLPRVGPDSFVELGFRGKGDLDEPMKVLKQMLKSQAIGYLERGGFK